MPEISWPTGKFWSSDYSSLSDSQKMEIDDTEIETFGDEALSVADMFSICRSRSHYHTVLLDDNKVSAYSVIRMKDDKILLKRLVVLKPYRNLGLGKIIHNSIILPGGLYCAFVHESHFSSQIWLRSFGWRAVKLQDAHCVFYRDLRKAVIPEDK
jgi:hypothetical protein